MKNKNIVECKGFLLQINKLHFHLLLSIVSNNIGERRVLLKQGAELFPFVPFKLYGEH